MERAWPSLVRLAWPDGMPPQGRRGVVELGEALFGRLSLGMLSREAESALDAGLRKAEALKERFLAALADRKPSEADRLGYELEDCLMELEQTASRLKIV